MRGSKLPELFESPETISRARPHRKFCVTNPVDGAPQVRAAPQRFAYNSGRENEASYDLAIAWGMASENMKMIEAIREEILSSVIRAHIRKEDFEKGRRVIKEI